MEIALEALRNGDIGLNANITFLNSSKIYLKRHLFCCGKYSCYCRRGIG